MRRLIALLEKELRQHAVAGIGLFVCLAGIYGLILLGAMISESTVSLMEVHAAFLFSVALGGMVLANRLVVAEYYGRTQLFVEALPLARWEVVAVKYFLGLTLLGLIAGSSLLVTALAALSREVIDARFLGIVAARSGAYLFFFWSFFFAMGFLGRFRLAIYGGILIALVLLEDQTAFEFQNFGPMVVQDPNTLPFERQTLPLRAILESLAFGAGWAALALGLALIHEGSVAETLARRMSQREKATMGILFVGLLFAIAVLEDRREKTPYSFSEEQEVLESAVVPLQIFYLLPENRDVAAALLSDLERQLEALAEELDRYDLPSVHLAYGPSLDPGIYDEATLQENEGILVRANFLSAEGWDPHDLHAHIVGLVLDELTEGRARFEPKFWLRDAFAHWWSVRGAADGGRAADEDLGQACRDGFPPLLRALWVTRHEPLGADRLATWFRYREQHGEDPAAAVAYSGLRLLEEQEGRDAVLNLARQVFGRRPPEDVRELFYEWRHPMATIFEEATTLRWQTWIDTWNAELERLRSTAPCREALATVLAEVPDAVATLEVEPGEGAVRNLVFGLRFVEPPPPSTLMTLLHNRLTPFDDELPRRDLRQVEKLWPAATREMVWTLPGFYSQGSRAFLALEVESTVLGCPLRLYAERRLFP